MASSSDSVNEPTQQQQQQKEEFPTHLLETVESVIEYKFKNRNLLEEALTHPSVSDADSYLRLKFIGGAVLQLAFSTHLYSKYADIVDTVKLSRLRDLNLSSQKLACLAVRFNLYRCVCHSSPRLCGKWVDRFVSDVQMNDPKEPLRGTVKAPQVLADIVEALAGAIFMDDELKLGTVWVVMSGLLEPVITPDMLIQFPQPAMYYKANGQEIPNEPEAATSLLEKRKALGPPLGLNAILAKKRKKSGSNPVDPQPDLTVPSKPRRSAAELESELELIKARVAELEAELSNAREATRAAEAITKAKEEKLAREMATREVEIENARQYAQYKALDSYGDEIVAVVNQHCFDSHVRALTLAGVKHKDPMWYNVEFPFEGTTPAMKFPWEVEGYPNGEASSVPVIDVPE